MKLPQSRPIYLGAVPTSSTKIAAEHLRPQLIWPSIPDSAENNEYDRLSAPEHWIIRKRQIASNSSGLGCTLFWQKLKDSEQILILDKFFDARAMITLREKLHKSKGSIIDLRIITSDDSARCLFSDITKLNIFARSAEFGCKSYKRYDENFDIVHDRFAVTDGELWHFGGTVGGIHPDLTAVSRGWDAESQNFTTLFNQIWNALYSPGGRK